MAIHVRSWWHDGSLDGMMHSISTPDGAPPISSAKSRIWSFYLRNGPGMAFLLRTRLLQNCAPTDPMDKVALCEKGRKRFSWDLHEYRPGNGDVDRLACLERYGLVHASRARAELECGICSSGFGHCHLASRACRAADQPCSSFNGHRIDRRTHCLCNG